jgi:hypothetical protein
VGPHVRGEHRRTAVGAVAGPVHHLEPPTFGCQLRARGLGHRSRATQDSRSSGQRSELEEVVPSDSLLRQIPVLTHP